VLDRFIQLVRLMSEDVGSNTRPFLYKSYILEVRKSLAGEMIAFKIAMRRTNPRTFYLHLLKELLREIVNSGLDEYAGAACLAQDESKLEYLDLKTLKAVTRAAMNLLAASGRASP
jgi:hypothetical protein